MTKQEILDTIAPCIKMYRAGGDTIEITKTTENIRITPGKDGAFTGQFINDFAAVCIENYIGFAVCVSNNEPCILL